MSYKWPLNIISAISPPPTVSHTTLSSTMRCRLQIYFCNPTIKKMNYPFNRSCFCLTKQDLIENPPLYNLVTSNNNNNLSLSGTSKRSYVFNVTYVAVLVDTAAAARRLLHCC